MEPAHSETGDCRVEPPASILVARLSMSHLVPLLEFNHATLALSIYGKRAASSLPAAEATLRRRLEALSGSAVKRGGGQVPEAIAEGLRGDRSLSDGMFGGRL